MRTVLVCVLCCFCAFRTARIVPSCHLTLGTRMSVVCTSRHGSVRKRYFRLNSPTVWKHSRVRIYNQLEIRGHCVCFFSSGQCNLIQITNKWELIEPNESVKLKFEWSIRSFKWTSCQFGWMQYTQRNYAAVARKRWNKFYAYAVSAPTE